MEDAGDAGNSKQMSLPPQVSVREEDGDQVQEYRRSGMLYMVVVTPKKGIPQTYMVDPDGTRRLVPGEAPVQPVMYKVLEWGKSKPDGLTLSTAGYGLIQHLAAEEIGRRSGVKLTHMTPPRLSVNDLSSSKRSRP